MLTELDAANALRTLSALHASVRPVPPRATLPRVARAAKVAVMTFLGEVRRP
jgi:hypothetical protein